MLVWDGMGWDGRGGERRGGEERGWVGMALDEIKKKKKGVAMMTTYVRRNIYIGCNLTVYLPLQVIN